MRIDSLYFINIRNHLKTELFFSKHINVFFGPNGAGKTSILEAISLATLSKSFLNTPENTLINFDEEIFLSKIETIRDRNTNFSVEIKKEKGSRKKISSSIMESMRPKDLIGNIPIIILSPDYKEITAGSPENRRRFLNTSISQISNNYLNNLYSYRKILKQRNNLLSKLGKEKSSDYKELNIWTDKLIEYGSKIILRRLSFVKELEPYFIKNYKKISDDKESVGMVYKPFGFSDLNNNEELNESNVIRKLEIQREKYKNSELKRQITLYGPQKDELELYINGFLAKETASQGQHKSILISLKLAEFDYMKDVLNETPIVLLDDIFSELDAKRTELVINTVLENLAQAFITITEDDKIKRIMQPSEDCYYFNVSEGKVTYVEKS